jgi:anthranilate synthase component 2
MLLLIDNYDSFTYNLKDYLEQLNETVIVVKNDEVTPQSLQNYTFNKVVISPGPNTPKESGNLMALINVLYKHYPILGVCLGHQALGEFFGAHLTHAIQPMHGKVSEIKCDSKGIYVNIPSNFKVCRYHSLVLKELNKTELNQTAHTSELECMSFEHQSLPIHGIQYHPEAILTENGLQILQNWLKIADSYKSS